MTLHLSAFPGGVTLLGSPDAKSTGELARGDGIDIGLRGQLVAASKPSDYVKLRDTGNAAEWDHLYALGHVVIAQQSRVIAVGNLNLNYQIAEFTRAGSASPVPVAQVFAAGPPHALANPGLIVTMAQMPVFPGGSERIFVNLGAREGFYPNLAPGLYLLVFAGPTLMLPISQFSALGQFPNTKQLYFRGITTYNNYLWGWGYDSLDATNRNGPCRVMFSAPGDGMSWGNDNIPGAPPRFFTDSDAVIVGDAGEIVRAGVSWNERLYIGTNKKLHFIGGYGRDSFISDGSNPVSKSMSVVGANAMIEGPDRNLYGVAEKSGLWVMQPGNAPEPIGRRLIDFQLKSRGYWDCIWTDPTQVSDYPGKTNRDLVWMVTDHEQQQVIIGIPWCNATTGFGYGTDTILLKYHTRTGGFTRQVYAGVCYTAADWVEAENQQREARFMGTATAGVFQVQKYAYQAVQSDEPAMPNPLPDVEFGPYAVFGPDGVGSIKRLYLTLAWGAVGSLPIKFTVTATGDEATIDTFTLTIAAAAPGAPATNDIWLDTSQTDTNIGNATAGATIPARGGYIARQYRHGAWTAMNAGGGHGARATIPLPVKRTKAARVSYRFLCTAAAGRFELEGLGTTPGGGTHGA